MQTTFQFLNIEMCVASMNRLNFSWVIPQDLAGCAGPRQKDDLLFLKQQGITLLVRLTEEDEAKVTSQQVTETGLTDMHMPIGDFEAPSQAQIELVTKRVLDCINNGGKVAVSCVVGVGRTGTMLCCILVALGHSDFANNK